MWRTWKLFLANQDVSALKFNEKFFVNDRFLYMQTYLEVGRHVVLLLVQDFAGFWVKTVEEMVQRPGRIHSSQLSNHAGCIRWSWGPHRWAELASRVYWLHGTTTTAFEIPYRCKIQTICWTSAPHHGLFFHGNFEFQYFRHLGQIGSKAMLPTERIWKISPKDSEIRRSFYSRNMNFRYNNISFLT